MRGPSAPGLLPRMAGSLDKSLANGPQALCSCPDLPTAAQELCHCLRGLLATAAADKPTSKAASEAGSASALSDQQVTAAGANAQALTSNQAAGELASGNETARRDAHLHHVGHPQEGESGDGALPESGIAVEDQPGLTYTHSAPAQRDTERPQGSSQAGGGEESAAGSLGMQAPDDSPQQWLQLFLALQGFALRIFAGAAPPQLLAAVSLQRSGLQLLEDRCLSLSLEALDRLMQPASPFAALRCPFLCGRFLCTSYWLSCSCTPMLPIKSTCSCSAAKIGKWKGR